MSLIKEALYRAYEILSENNIPSPLLDSRVILGFVLNEDLNYLVLNGDKEISKEKEKLFFSLINRRKEKEPVAYIVEKKEFMRLSFKVNENTLIPRSDTEILVEEVLANLNGKNQKLHILDMCTGSGCIGISLAYYLGNAKVSLSDVSLLALEVARENISVFALEDRVGIVQSDLFQNIKGNFDVIVSNPPYIKEEDILALMKDVKDYEPMLALKAEDKGLFFYKEISKKAKEFLKEDGFLAFEIGYDQGREVANILKENNYRNIKVVKDLANLDRVVLGFK